MTIWLTLLTLGSAMAVVEEPTEERSSNNCHCEQVQHGGIHGASPASMCDKGCPGGTFCSQAQLRPQTTLSPGVIACEPPFCPPHPHPHLHPFLMARSFTAAGHGRARLSTAARGFAPRRRPRPVVSQCPSMGPKTTGWGRRSGLGVRTWARSRSASWATLAPGPPAPPRPSTSNSVRSGATLRESRRLPRPRPKRLSCLPSEAWSVRVPATHRLSTTLPPPYHQPKLEA